MKTAMARRLAGAGCAQPTADSARPRTWENGYWLTSVQCGFDRVLRSVLVDGKGFARYSDKDSTTPPRSARTGDCLLRWPPVLVNEKITFRNIDAGQNGAVIRQDGIQQLTTGGRPACRYVDDVVPGRTKGQGVDGTWCAIGPGEGRAGTDTSAR